MSLRENQTMFAFNVARLITWCSDSGMEVTFGDAFRSPEAQAAALAAGKTKVAKGYHNVRLAVDLNLFRSDGSLCDQVSEYEPMGTYWESLHPQNKSGCFWTTFPDADHFEMHVPGVI